MLLCGCVPRPAAEVGERAVGGTWSAYQGGAGHNAVIPRSSMSTYWTTELGGRSNGGLALVGDTIFATTFAPSVVSVDLESGTVKWRYGADNVVMSTPIVSADTVFVGTGTDRHASRSLWGRPEGDFVIALDRVTGRERWRFRTTGEDMPSPVLAGDTLVFANGDGHAYGLRASSGKLLWKTALAGISTMASANRSGSNAIVSTCTTRLSPGHTYAIRISDGNVRWQAPYGNCDSSPAVVDGRVFVSGVDLIPSASGIGYQAVISALDAATGKVDWIYRTHDLGLSSTVVSSERAVAGTYSMGVYYQSLPTHDRLVALDARTGRMRWAMRTLGPAKMSPLIDKGRLYIGDTVGCLYIMDARTGAMLGYRSFKAPFSTSPPIIVGRTLLITAGSMIHAIPLVGGVPHQRRPGG